MVVTLNKALVIFAKEPVPGKVKTRMTPPLSAEEAAELYACMLGDVVAMASTLPQVEKYLFFDGGDKALSYFRGIAPTMIHVAQRGVDLGDKMAAAFAEAFARGHDTAVIIGTDSPDLPPGFIEAAFSMLGQGDVDVVIGPCEDGGYYAVGMKMLHRDIFRDVPWGSDRVLSETLVRAADAGLRVSMLSPWRDLDTPSDLISQLLSADSRAKQTQNYLTQRSGRWSL